MRIHSVLSVLIIHRSSAYVRSGAVPFRQVLFEKQFSHDHHNRHSFVSLFPWHRRACIVKHTHTRTYEPRLSSI
ncbi:hypothetical protein M431DRAFT_263185 [Trichoderma harzianum CBS 226.95]|uniref:Uncharacterized protein n=1 Tax=Trichoderma harzianum CBS 226.95 TaxID=983964 RepID=A0A2T3ZZI1_TRIHA|nr:hypothetical protein M431DRAFT_263185 [Trichoderma harzianum CBS 226.95]PTB50224.1 hypothetical protein M431DRAFT_263185 [Trichoderma harzianum CBS 226.95]